MNGGQRTSLTGCDGGGFARTAVCARIYRECPVMTFITDFDTRLAKPGNQQAVSNVICCCWIQVAMFPQTKDPTIRSEHKPLISSVHSTVRHFRSGFFLFGSWYKHLCLILQLTL